MAEFEFQFIHDGIEDVPIKLTYSDEFVDCNSTPNFALFPSDEVHIVLRSKEPILFRIPFVDFNIKNLENEKCTKRP